MSRKRLEPRHHIMQRVTEREHAELREWAASVGVGLAPLLIDAGLRAARAHKMLRVPPCVECDGHGADIGGDMCPICDGSGDAKVTQ